MRRLFDAEGAGHPGPEKNDSASAEREENDLRVPSRAIDRKAVAFPRFPRKTPEKVHAVYPGEKGLEVDAHHLGQPPARATVQRIRARGAAGGSLADDDEPVHIV